VSTHDGTGSVRAFPIDVRIVCANTVAAAISKRDRKSTINIRHSGILARKVADAQRLFKSISEDFSLFEEWMKRLAETPTTPNQWKEVVNIILPEPAPEVTGRAKTIYDNKLAALLYAYESEVALIPQFTTNLQPTAYDVFNGITRFVDRDRSERKRSQFEYAVLGSGQDFKQDGIDAINEVFGVPLMRIVG